MTGPSGLFSSEGIEGGVEERPAGRAQPLAVHASQQLAWTPTHADRPSGPAVSALDFVEHFVVPSTSCDNR